MLGEIGDLPIVEEKVVSELIGRDDEEDSLFERLFEIYVEECPELLEALGEALEAGNSESCYEAIHQMKGSAASMGAARVYALAKKAIELCESGEILKAEGVVNEFEREMNTYCEEIKKRPA